MKKDSKAKIASKYALALYESAEDTKSAAKVFQDVDKVLSLIQSDKAFIQSFSNPIWEADSKKSALQLIAKKAELTKETLNCLNLVVDYGRIKDLEAILEEFRAIYYKKHNITVVNVQTVKPLSTEQNKKLYANLEKMLSKKVMVNYRIKPEILGGLVIEYDSNMIDDSVLGKLKKLELIMKGGQ